MAATTTSFWSNQRFEVYEKHDAQLLKTGGIYIFAGFSVFGVRQPNWHAFYVGQTEDFSTRLPGHEKWNEAYSSGATHVHILVNNDLAERLVIETNLIDRLQPNLNE